MHFDETVEDLKLYLSFFYKVACTWDQVKGMAEISENYTSSPAIHSRNKMLHAILELQTALGLQDLGLLHPVPYRDSHGAVVFVIVQYVKVGVLV